MKKLTLDLDMLEVESFAVSPERELPAGTVQGQGYTEAYTCDYNMCNNTNPSACGCEMSVGDSCYCTAGDWTCADYDTCGWPCALSDMTNCHRCTFDRTNVCTG